MGCLGTAFGLLILAGWISGATFFLTEQKAHGEPLVLPLVLLGFGILTAAAVAGIALQKVVPAWRSGNARAPAVVTVVLAVVAMAGIYVAVDTGVENRRPGADLVAALAPACRGTAVAGAGAISTDGTPNHLVVLDRQGAEGDWTGHPSIELRPPNLADAELVVCVDPDVVRTELQVCSYTGGPPITRYAVSRDVEVRAAASGDVVMAFTATAEPRACHQTESQDLTELVGTLDWTQVEARLWYLVKWGADPATVVKVGTPVALDLGPLSEIGFVVENTGKLPISLEVLVSYPAEDGDQSIQVIPVDDLSPTERRVVTATLADLAPESSVAMEAKVGVVEAGDSNPERLDLARKVTVTAPTLPLDQAATEVEVTVRNAAPVKLGAHVTIGFLAGGNLVAVAEGQAETIPGGSSAKAVLAIVGSLVGVDGTIAQVDSAIEVE